MNQILYLQIEWIMWPKPLTIQSSLPEEGGHCERMSPLGIDTQKSSANGFFHGCF